MADETIKDATKYGGNKIIVTKLQNYQEAAGKIATGVTTAQPGMPVKENASSTTLQRIFELCNAGDCAWTGVLLESPGKDIETAFAALDPVRVVTGGAVVRMLVEENIGAISPEFRCELSGTDGYIIPEIENIADERNVLGWFTIIRAKDASDKIVAHVRLMR